MRGAVGILSFDITTRDKKLVNLKKIIHNLQFVIWQLPFDYNLYGNVLNGKIGDIEDEQLSEELVLKKLF
jgi:hypothetical protein